MSVSFTPQYVSVSPCQQVADAARQAGFPEFVMRDWQGLVVRAGTPRDSINALNVALNRTIALPEVRALLAKIGNEAAGGTPEQFGQLIASDSERWARLVKTAGIKVD